MLLVGVVGAVVYGGIALATPPSGLMNIPLARGTDASNGTLPIQVGTDVVMAQITVDPGGSSGWHSHPGGAIIVVKQGTPTVYRSVGSQCQTPRTAPGTRSSSGRAKWTTSSTRARLHTSSTSPSRVCLPAAPREPTSQTPAPARVSDDLTERGVPITGDVALLKTRATSVPRDVEGSKGFVKSAATRRGVWYHCAP